MISNSNYYDLTNITDHLISKFNISCILKGSGGNNKSSKDADLLYEKYIWFHIKETLYLKVYIYKDKLNDYLKIHFYLNDTKNNALIKDLIVGSIKYNTKNYYDVKKWEINYISANLFKKEHIDVLIHNYTNPLFIKNYYNNYMFNDLKLEQFDEFIQSLSYLVTNFSETFLFYQFLLKYMQTIIEKTNGKYLKNEYPFHIYCIPLDKNNNLDTLKLYIELYFDRHTSINSRCLYNKFDSVESLYIIFRLQYNELSIFDFSLNDNIKIKSLIDFTKELKDYIGPKNYSYLKLLINN